MTMVLLIYQVIVILGHLVKKLSVRFLKECPAIELLREMSSNRVIEGNVQGQSALASYLPLHLFDPEYLLFSGRMSRTEHPTSKPYMRDLMYLAMGVMLKY